MTMRRMLPIGIRAAAAAFGIAIGTVHAAETLYAASVGSLVSGDTRTKVGNLYRVDAATGSTQLVAPIRVGGSVPIGITGLADHPATGVVYGITSARSPNHPHTLVTLDVETGDATVIGDLGLAGSDIAFDNAGNLFVWLRETAQLGVIDLGTGAVSAVGTPGSASATGGLAIDAKGQGYVAATGASGTLDRVDTNTGVITRGPVLQAAPYAGGINSLAVSPDGALFAVNTNLGAVADTVLVRIDPASGKVTRIGALPNETDALVFIDTPWKPLDLLASRGTLTLIAALLAIGAAIVLMRSPRRR